MKNLTGKMNGCVTGNTKCYIHVENNMTKKQ